MVKTEGGMVEGETISLGLSCSMDIFKRIPFADIPGRFEKPKRHPGWGGGWTTFFTRFDIFSNYV